MTDRWGRGSTATLTAYFREGGSGVLVDAAPVKVDIIDPDDIVVVTDADPTSHPSTGTYTYQYAIGVGAKLGVWTARWTGVINAVPVTGEDPFEVVAAGQVGFLADTFATVAELASYLAVTLDDEDPRAVLALQMATGIIQNEAKHRIFLYTDDEKVLRGAWGSGILLPEPPVHSITSVTVGDDEIDAVSGFTFVRSGVLMRGIAWNDFPAYWDGPNVDVTVVYTHGFDPVPADIKALCLQVAARVFYSQGGVDSETIGGYSYSVGNGSSGVQLTEDERRICRRYWPVTV